MLIPPQENYNRPVLESWVSRNDSSSRLGFASNSDRKKLNSQNKSPQIFLADSSHEPMQDCGVTFCTADPNYPIDIISTLDLDKFEHLFGDDLVENFAVRFDADESGLCQSRKRLIHPKKGQTVQNTWLTIINDDDKYKQGVLIEECLNAHLPCDYSQNFPLSVESKCKQQHVFRSLLAINQGKLVMEHFQFPSCCKCMVTSSRSYNRFGESSDNERKDRLTFA